LDKLKSIPNNNNYIVIMGVYDDAYSHLTWSLRNYIYYTLNSKLIYQVGFRKPWIFIKQMNTTMYYYESKGNRDGTIYLHKIINYDVLICNENCKTCNGPTYNNCSSCYTNKYY